MGIEVAAEDLEEVLASDRESMREEISKRGQISLALTHKAATYMENAIRKIFAHLQLWLETGIVAPRTTSILENITRELGRPRILEVVLCIVGTLLVNLDSKAV